MNRAWLPHAILRAASSLVPRAGRAEWLQGWRSELWYVPRRGSTMFCCGAFRDALWVRRNGDQEPARPFLESPLHCLVFLAVLALAGSTLSICLPRPESWGPSSHLALRELPMGWAAMLVLTCLLLPAARLGMGPAPAGSQATGRVWRGMFLALKIALVQPILLCGLVVLIWILPVVPVAPQLGVCGAWMLGFRWILADQRRRCPVCLRRLSSEVRMGAPSQTFLEWYGAESTCSRGHGLLHVPGVSAGYSAPRWLRLDNSWSGLFVAGSRRR